jgi:cyclin H
LELVELVNEGALQFEKDEVRKILDDARQWGLDSLRTDAQFLFTPPQIALACLFHFNAELVRQFLAIKFPPGRILSPANTTKMDVVLEIAKQELDVLQGKEEDAAEKLLKTVMECDVLICERLDVIKDRSKEYVTGIDKKLYQCKKLLDSQSTESSPPSDTAKRKSDTSDDNTRNSKRSKPE